MNNEYWLNRWVENRIGFHRPDVNPLLVRFFPAVAGDSRRVLVPLCGKSLDLAWLLQSGLGVTGVDLSEVAATAFFQEQGIDVSVAEDPPFTVMRGGGLTFYVGDVLQVSPERIGRFDLIYDRAALIALPDDVRKQYAERLRAVRKPGARMLLISLEYDPAEMAGPPYCVGEPEVRALFADGQVDKLHEYSCIDNEPHFRERGLTWMNEVVYRIAWA